MTPHLRKEVQNLRFASDVEVAAVEPAGEGEIPQLVPPAYLTEKFNLTPRGFHNGSSSHPILLHSMNYKWYQDGALFETDFQPCLTGKEMYRKFKESFQYLDGYLIDNFKLVAWNKPVAQFDVERFVEMGSENVRESCIAGCSPDEDAFDSSYESVERSLLTWKYRGAGGHLHMSVHNYTYGDSLHKWRIPAISLLALFVGNEAIVQLSEEDLPLEKIRRQEFGAAGRHRFPFYPNGQMGLEYRSLSNSWFSSQETVERIFGRARQALHYLFYDKVKARELLGMYLEDSIEAIQNVDVELSKEILSHMEEI